jgi:hypothetical protein
MRTRAYRFSGNTPAFPAQWVDGLYVLSPATNSSCHRHQRIDDWQKPGRASQISAGLTSATDARTTRFRRTQLSRLRRMASPGMARRNQKPGRPVRRSLGEGGKRAPVVLRAFATAHGKTRPAFRSRARRCRVHRIPPHVNDDRDTPLSRGRTGGIIQVIWGWVKEYSEKRKNSNGSCLRASQCKLLLLLHICPI